MQKPSLIAAQSVTELWFSYEVDDSAIDLCPVLLCLIFDRYYDVFYVTHSQCRIQCKYVSERLQLQLKQSFYTKQYFTPNIQQVGWPKGMAVALGAKDSWFDSRPSQDFFLNALLC